MKKQASDCAIAVKMLGQTHVYTAEERENRARTVSLLSATLETELRRLETMMYDLAQEDRMDLQSTPSPSQSQKESMLSQEVDFEDALLQDRREELARVESHMHDLQLLIADTSKLVTTQGETIDRIDVHMDKAVKYTDKATDELRKTERRQKTKRALICLMIFALVIGIVVVVVLVTVET